MRRDEVEDVDEEDNGERDMMRNATKQNKKNYFIVFDY